MDINIFALTSMQPLVWIALIALAVAALFTFFWGRSMYDYKLLPLYPQNHENTWLKWFYGILVAIAMVLWVIVVIANHTTVWYDLINIVFLIGFSLIFIMLVEVVMAIVSFIMICLFIGLWLSWQSLIIRFK